MMAGAALATMPLLAQWTDYLQSCKAEINPSSLKPVLSGVTKLHKTSMAYKVPDHFGKLQHLST